jgi:DNA-binding MarR family transcriptional regulator
MEKKNETQPLNESIWFLLYRSQRQVSAALRKTFSDAGYDLTPEQWAVLLRLREEEGLNQSQLAEKSAKDRHNITRILKQLNRRGYIEKRRDESSKRAFHVYLAPAGRTLLEEAQPLLFKHRDRMYSGFSKDDVLKFSRYLERIVKNMQLEE